MPTENNNQVARTAPSELTPNIQEVIENAQQLAAEDYPQAYQVGCWMSQEKVSKISVEYSGGGDEGDFYQGVLEEGHCATLAPQLPDLSSSVASEIVDLRHSGWHNCGGATGTVYLQLTSETQDCLSLLIQVFHSDKYESGSEPAKTIFFSEGRGDETPKPIPETMEKLRGLMAAANISVVTAEYSGSGDEGDIESITAADGESVSEEIQSLAYDVAWDALERSCSGWEDNQGGSGTVVIMLDTEDHEGFTVEVNHSDTCEESAPDEYAVIIHIPIAAPAPALIA